MALGLILIFLSFWLARYDNYQASFSVDQATGEILSTSFANEPVSVDLKILQFQPDQKVNKSPPVRIVIPSLNIDLPVKESKIVNGYWEVFPDTAGFGIGSAYPDETGNQVIFAHARKGLFEPLKNIKPGADITVFTNDKWYSYTVSEIKEVVPTDTEVISATKETVLTLYTCSGYADSRRLIVISKKNPV